ncbi:MAG: hypothetical protein U0167_15275 [bacterium]
MRPIQLWLSNFSSNPFIPAAQRVRQRAYESWRGEDIVWIVPELGPPRTDQQKGIRVLALDGDYIERLVVMHVGENGYVWGPGLGLFPSGKVDGLLTDWLNVSGQFLYRGVEHITIDAPDPSAEGIKYRPRRLSLRPIGAMPIKVVDREACKIELRWPPAGTFVKTISIDQESHERVGPFVRDETEPELPVFTGKDGRASVLLRCGWPPPFDHLLDFGAGFDAILQLAHMQRIAAQSDSDVEAALIEAQVRSRPFLVTGISNWELAHLWPICAKEGEAGALIAGSVHFNIEGESLRDLLLSEEWRRMAWRPIPIRRAWGFVGLMWALLLDELEARRPFRRCKACGRVISKAHGRRFCTRAESAECVKSRQRSRASKHRGRHGVV